MTEFRRIQRARSARTRPLRANVTASAIALLALAGCGSTSDSAASHSKATSAPTILSNRHASTTSTNSKTTVASDGPTSSTTSTQVAPGSNGSTPTLPPQLTAPPANGSSPKLSADQWSEAAAAYDAIPSLDPCVASKYFDALGTTTTPGDNPSPNDAKAYLEAYSAVLRLYARSVQATDPTDAATLLNALAAAVPKLDGPFPAFFDAYFNAFDTNHGSDATSAISSKLLGQCES